MLAQQQLAKEPILGASIAFRSLRRPFASKIFTSAFGPQQALRSRHSTIPQPVQEQLVAGVFSDPPYRRSRLRQVAPAARPSHAGAIRSGAETMKSDPGARRNWL